MRGWLRLPEASFLRRKVARRVLLVFVLCALVPVTGFALVAFFQVTSQLSSQSAERLRQSSKAAAMSIIDRLDLLEDLLAGTAREIAAGGQPGARTGDRRGVAGGLVSLALTTARGDQRIYWGAPDDVPPPGDQERQHLRAGRTLVSTHPRPGRSPRVLMWMRLGATGETLVAEIDPSVLWGGGDRNTLPPATELCVYDHRGTVLACTVDPAPRLPSQPGGSASGPSSTSFEWMLGDRPHLAGSWSIPMMYRFAVPRWTVVVSEPRADVLAPIASFTHTFPLVALLSLWIVVLLSLRHVRRTLGPLDALQAATRSFAARDFGHRVAVTSGDEFEELGHSLNAMADRLGRQFNTLTALAALDSAILSSLDAEAIASTLVGQMRTVVPCDEVRVTLAGGPGGPARTYIGPGDPTGSASVVDTELTPHEIQMLREHPGHLVVDLAAVTAPSYLLGAARPDLARYLVCPVLLRERLAAIVSLGYAEPPALSDDDHAAVRQLADQLAVALANAADVAERKRAERWLLESKRQLEQALSDLEATQQQVLQQERLRALGQMASGVAHDFNNTLTPILGYTELLLSDPRYDADPEKRRRFVKVVNTAAKDAANVVRRLREFYRADGHGEPVGEIDLNVLVKQVIALTQPRWRDQALGQGAAIHVRTNLRATVTAAGIEAEIREVLTNLIFNAVDALPGGGVITLATWEEDDRAVLAVSDTGIGMSEEVRRRCLDPFFSTKGEKGTGLGLAMVYGVVNRHKGSIEIDSEPGQGTTFTIRLPAWSPDQAAPAAATVAPVREALTVLLVDDDQGARDVVAEYLAADGHRVATAADGRRGWETFRADRFDVIVTDQAMPEMSGDDLIAAVRQVAPSLPIILLSGFADFREDDPATESGADVTIGKPVTVDALRQAIAQAFACHAERLTPQGPLA